MQNNFQLLPCLLLSFQYTGSSEITKNANIDTFSVLINISENIFSS